jgi:hypothetical protein
MKIFNQSPIDPDHLFNHDHDHDENLKSKSDEKISAKVC